VITPVRKRVFTNKSTVGKFAKITFDTYSDLPDGKEEVLDVEGKIHYFEKGSGKVLLLLHGAAQSCYTFRNNLDSLSRHFRVVMPDLPGHGYSDCPDIAYTVEEYSLGIQSFLNQVSGERLSIVAFGQAAAYAVDFTSYNQDWVEELVLIHPGAFANTGFPSAKALAGPLGGHAAAKYAKPSYMRKSLEKAYFDKTILNEKNAEEYARPFENPDVRSAVRLAVANYDDTQAVAKLNTLAKKVLLISSQDDPVHDDESLQQMISHTVDGYSLSVRNCGYLPQEEKAETINQGILEFVTK